MIMAVSFALIIRPNIIAYCQCSALKHCAFHLPPVLYYTWTLTALAGYTQKIRETSDSDCKRCCDGANFTTRGLNVSQHTFTDCMTEKSFAIWFQVLPSALADQAPTQLAKATSRTATCHSTTSSIHQYSAHTLTAKDRRYIILLTGTLLQAGVMAVSNVHSPANCNLTCSSFPWWSQRTSRPDTGYRLVERPLVAAADRQHMTKWTMLSSMCLGYVLSAASCRRASSPSISAL